MLKVRSLPDIRREPTIISKFLPVFNPPFQPGMISQPLVLLYQHLLLAFAPL